MKIRDTEKCSICSFAMPTSARAGPGWSQGQELIQIFHMDGRKDLGLLPPRHNSRKFDWKQSSWDLTQHFPVGCRRPPRITRPALAVVISMLCLHVILAVLLSTSLPFSLCLLLPQPHFSQVRIVLSKVWNLEMNSRLVFFLHAAYSSSNFCILLSTSTACWS